MTASKLTKNPSRNSQLRGFTLVEMLTVMGIMAILGALVIPAMQGLQKGSGFTSTVYNMSDMMSLARTYAVANNTYVYVGFKEVNRSQSTSTSPQAAGYGRVAVCIVATSDGTNTTVASGGGTGSNLILVRPVQLFDFLHVAGTAFANPASGNMARPDGTSFTTLSGFTGLSFGYPLTASSPKYSFTQVVCFNPQGGVVSGSGNAIQWAELDLQPFSGNAGTVAPAAPANVSLGNQAALVVEGATGANTVYRP